MDNRFRIPVMIFSHPYNKPNQTFCWIGVTFGWGTYFTLVPVTFAYSESSQATVKYHSQLRFSDTTSTMPSEPDNQHLQGPWNLPNVIYNIETPPDHLTSTSFSQILLVVLRIKKITTKCAVNGKLPLATWYEKNRYKLQSFTHTRIKEAMHKS